MIKPHALVAVLAALLAVFAGTASAGSSNTTIHLDLPGTKSSYVDLGPKGYSGGDYFVTTGRVLDRATGKPAGRLGGIWTIISRAADNASFDLGLAHGTLIVDGRIVHAARQSTLSIVAGTGSYTGAHGTVTFRYLSETTAALDVRLR
ncbi:MAG: allene oxide cyclase barrel-like domain-containing protein [Gaiellaceae bacterium]